MTCNPQPGATRSPSRPIRSWLASCCALAVMLAASPYAVAQESPQEEPSAEAIAEAREHQQKGLTHYNLGEFDEAIAEYKKAYDLTKAPGFIFNIAQAQRLKKDYQAALYSYRTFLRLLPEAENRADAEARIKELEELVAKGEGVPADPAKEPKPDEAAPADRTADASDEPDDASSAAGTGADFSTTRDATDTGARGGRGLRLVGITTMGVGAALLATGAVFGLRASSADSDLTDMAQNGEVWDQAARDKYDAGERDEKIAIAGLAVGGAAVVTGAVLYLVGRSKANASNRTAWIAPTAGGASVAVSWGF